MEPPGPDPFLVENIYMIKNINTELTYRIFLQVIPGEAAQSQDYDTSVRPFAVLDFPPNQQRLQVFGQLLSFEAFQMFSLKVKKV